MKERERRFFQAPFSARDFVTAVSKLKEYKAAGNFFWQDLENPNDQNEVPLSSRGIDSLVTHYYDQPRPMPQAVTVAVQCNQTITDGKLFVLSPIEFAHAFVIAVHGALTAGDVALLEKWRDAALMTSYHFKICDGADNRHFEAKQLREDFGANEYAVRQTAVGNIIELIKFRARKEKVSGKLNNGQVAELYKNNVKFSAGNDDQNETPTSEPFINMATFVYKRILSIPACRDMLMAADEAERPNPLDKVCKLNVLATKGKTEEGIQWTISLILDYCHTGVLSVEQVGTRWGWGLGARFL